MTTPFANNKPQSYDNMPRFIVNEMGDGRFMIFELEKQIGYSRTRLISPSSYKVSEDAIKAIKEFEVEEEAHKLRNQIVRRVYP